MRRHSGCLLELLDEIAGVVETYFQCDLCDRGVGMQKQRLGFLDAQVIDVAIRVLPVYCLNSFIK